MLIQLWVSFALSMQLLSVAEAGTFTDKICELLFLKRPAKVEAPVAVAVAEKPESDLWIDNVYEDPKWVMEQARSTFEQLDKLPLPERNQKNIEYFRKQLPLLTQLLREIRAPANAKYWMVNEDGEQINSEIQTVEQAREWLVKEAKDHYFGRSASLEWFPEFVMEVIGLRWYVHQMSAAKWKMPDYPMFFVWYQDLIQKKAFGVLNENPFWYQFHMLRNKMILRTERQQGFLHWPTIASLKMKHFNDWHLGIKPLGYTKLIKAWADGVETDVFDLYDHDIAFHLMPPEFLPYRRSFTDFKRIYDQKAAQEKIDQQVLLRLQWFSVTHETTALYHLFVQFMQNQKAFDITDKVEQMSDQFLAWIINNPTGVTSPNNKTFNGEWTESLKKMSPEQRTVEAGQAFQTFRRHLIHSLEEYKKSL